MEKRSIQCEIRATAEKTIVGKIPYNSASENLGGFKEYLNPGCFSKAIRSGKKILALWNHDSGKPLANTRAGTLILTDSPEALHVTIKPSLDTSWGRDALEASKRGDINGMSFGFTMNPSGEEWKDDIRTILEVSELFEFSPVSFPAYPETTINVRGNKMQYDNDITPVAKADSRSRIEERVRRDVELEEARENLFNQYPDKWGKKMRSAIDQIITNERTTGQEIRMTLDDPESNSGKEIRSYLRGEARSLTVGTDSEGGYTVPEDLEAKISAELRARNVVRQVAKINKTETEALDIVVNRGGTAASFVSETASRPETSAPSFEKVSIPLHDMYGNIFITQQLLDDSAADMEGFIREEISGKMGALEESKFINGTGSGEPTGIMDYTKTTDGDSTRTFGQIEHMVAAATSAITSDELIELVYKLASQYRTGSGFLMNSQTVMVLRKLKDSSGQYLWQPGLTIGEPARLMGYPVYTCEQMPSIGASTSPIAFANWPQAYRVVDHVRGTLLLRDPYTSRPYVTFYASRRVGGAMVEDKAIKLLTMAAS